MESNKLPDLPNSDDDVFWAQAEVYTQLVPKKVHKEEPHLFIRVTGRSAQCTHCDWGFDLDPGDEIKDGHLYTKEGKLVI
jgi:hypothetical protein